MVTCHYLPLRPLVALRYRGVGQAWPNGPPRCVTEGLALVVGERGRKGDIEEREGEEEGEIEGD